MRLLKSLKVSIACVVSSICHLSYLKSEQQIMRNYPFTDYVGPRAFHAHHRISIHSLTLFGCERVSGQCPSVLIENGASWIASKLIYRQLIGNRLMIIAIIIISIRAPNWINLFSLFMKPTANANNEANGKRMKRTKFKIPKSPAPREH